MVWEIHDERIVYLLLLAPLFLIIAGLFIYPIGYTIYLSLTDQDLLALTQARFLGLENYISILENIEFWQDLGRSLLFTFGSLALQVPIGIGIALTLTAKIRGINILRTIMLYPYIVPIVVITSLWRWLFNPSFGIYNYGLQQLGIIDAPISVFGTPTVAMGGVILVSLWTLTPFVVIIVLGRLLTIPSELYEAAELDGASPIRKFRYVTLPQLKGVLLTVVVLRTIWNYRIFDLVWLLTGGGPIRTTTTLPIRIYETLFLRLKVGLASAIAVVSFVIFLGFLLIVIKSGYLR